MSKLQKEFRLQCVLQACIFPSPDPTYCQKRCSFIGAKLPSSHKCNWNCSKGLEIKSKNESQTFTDSCTQSLFSQKTRLTAHSLVLNLQFLLQDCTGDMSLTTQVTEHCSHSVWMDVFLNTGIERWRENCFPLVIERNPDLKNIHFPPKRTNTVWSIRPRKIQLFYGMQQDPLLSPQGGGIWARNTVLPQAILCGHCREAGCPDQKHCLGGQNAAMILSDVSVRPAPIRCRLEKQKVKNMYLYTHIA